MVEDRMVRVMAQDLFTVCTLGRGAFGIVDRMEHQPTGTIMAVKVIIVIEFKVPFSCNVAHLHVHATTCDGFSHLGFFTNQAGTGHCMIEHNN